VAVIAAALAFCTWLLGFHSRHLWLYRTRSLEGKWQFAARTLALFIGTVLVVKPVAVFN
jgi:hypothetical protein